MNKREFLQKGLGGALLVAAGLSGASTSVFGADAPFILPALPYPFAALEPYIDAETMEIHHDKHHKAYVDKLNEAVKVAGFEKLTLDELLASKAATNVAIRNHGGGHYNHDLFWKILSPAAEQKPGEKLMSAINKTFGSFEKFQELFTTAALSRFGSGWAWLCLDANKKLFISSTANQDNPLMKLEGIQSGIPLMGLDIWEHAYYLKYQNRRAEYVNAFWKVLNWEFVSQRFVQM